MARGRKNVWCISEAVLECQRRMNLDSAIEVASRRHKTRKTDRLQIKLGRKHIHPALEQKEARPQRRFLQHSCASSASLRLIQWRFLR